nr:MAG: major capsid protein [Microviridae sp.]
METTLGGDRLGSGNKQQISMKNYERSTHDLSYLWRSTMSSGTLVPFINKVALPGDKFEIDLRCEILTTPTVGPLFGSYKVQLDVFEIPMRLYNAKLHMNKLGVGMDMSKIFIPQLKLKVNNHPSYVKTYDDNEQINASSLMKYLGISGIGRISGATNPATRNFNAIPYLAYWDIYKNYYSNKQENIGYVIHTDTSVVDIKQTPTAASLIRARVVVGNVLDPAAAIAMVTGDNVEITYPAGGLQPDWTKVSVKLNGTLTPADLIFTSSSWSDRRRILTLVGTIASQTGKTIQVVNAASTPLADPKLAFGIVNFPLPNIDTMRDKILQFAGVGAYIIDSAADAPYGYPMAQWNGGANVQFSVQYNQEGLALKTYQSDLFNNWVNTAWIDGVGGIADITAVSTVGNEFTIDALNIASKVYDMLNRIAVSGGTYDNWLEAVYTHERVKGVESPVYCGGLIKELGFEEVISNANTSVSGDNQPLGTLAGRGKLTSKHKGGKVEITVNEPSIIMGLVSITPRIEYSQGNDWAVNLQTYNDLHKPALDAIGFQDLITDQLLWSDSIVDSTTGVLTKKSLGKQPAWINYMTEVNKCYGGFAEINNSMFMVLNRRYEKQTDGQLKDGTTYIDPTKYNQIFAETALDSQNFWVQISVDMTARRKMSAKIIPNL